MEIAEKIRLINDYNESVGSVIRYEMTKDEDIYRCNDIETGDDFDEVSEEHINSAFEQICKKQF